MWRSRFLLPRLSCTIGCDIGARVHASWKSSCAGSDGALVKPPRPGGRGAWDCADPIRVGAHVSKNTAASKRRIEATSERNAHLQLHRARQLILSRHSEAGAARPRTRIDD